jgi:hypothetical protein
MTVATVVMQQLVAKLVLLQMVVVTSSCYSDAATDTTIMWNCDIGICCV